MGGIFGIAHVKKLIPKGGSNLFVEHFFEGIADAVGKILKRPVRGDKICQMIIDLVALLPIIGKIAGIIKLEIEWVFRNL